MVAYRKNNEKKTCSIVWWYAYSILKRYVGLIHFRRLSKDNSAATNDVAQVGKDKKSYRENDRVLNRWREKFI